MVALNTDASVKRLGKEGDRPVNPLADRVAVIAALEAVTLVTWFDADTPLELIVGVRPDVLAKGGEYLNPRVVSPAPAGNDWPPLAQLRSGFRGRHGLPDDDPEFWRGVSSRPAFGDITEPVLLELGLEVGQVHPRLVGIGREGTGEDRRVLARRVVVPPARGVAALPLPLLGSPWRRVLASARAATLLLWSRVVVHDRLACQPWFMEGILTSLRGCDVGWWSPPGVGVRVLGIRVRSGNQTLRVPARVVMLGPPYPLISPMSRVRI